MADMNKRPQGVSRRSELEKELIGDIAHQAAVTGTGRDEKLDDPFSKKKHGQYRGFAIHQGVRRRHPERVLAQFAAIVEETSNAESAWEKALMHESKRVEVPSEYKTNDGAMIVNQTGLVTTALDNYKSSHEKFSRTILAGV